ncbi:MAG: branched-chain amino acid ABC transporter permease [Actinobacteria bacterium]|nr:branched-chain amino acid ABC transporter permease [Actinomycetota bacterium]
MGSADDTTSSPEQIGARIAVQADGPVTPQEADSQGSVLDTTDLTGVIGRRRLNPLAAFFAGQGPEWTRLAALGLLLVVAVLLPFVIKSDRWLTLFTIVLIYVVLASGLNIVVGFTGLLDLGYVAFYAIGGYYTAVIFVQVLKNGFGIPIQDLWWLAWVNLLVGGGMAALAGAVLGYPTLRLRGDYLAIMTLGFGEIIRIVANNWVSLTRGPSGISGIPKFALGDFVFKSNFRSYFLILVLAVISLFLVSRLVRSRVGRAWTAVREDQVAAAAMGINTSRYKLLSYASGAFFAGVMGVFFGHYLNFIHPSNFKLMESIVMLCLVVLGGMGSIVGPAVGAAIWITLQEWLRDFPFVEAHPEIRGMAMGLVLVMLMIFRPQGILGGSRMALHMKLRRRRAERNP